MFPLLFNKGNCFKSLNMNSTTRKIPFNLKLHLFSKPKKNTDGVQKLTDEHIFKKIDFKKNENKGTTLYIALVVVAIILTTNKEKFYIPRGRFVQWFEFLSCVPFSPENLDSSISIVVYPNSGLSLENISQKGIWDSESSTTFDPVLTNFYHTSQVQKFINLLLEKCNMTYDQINVIYKPQILPDYWGFALIPILLLLTFLLRFTKGGSDILMGRAPMSNEMSDIFGEKFGKKHMIENIKTNFTNVLGCEEAKMEIKEFVSYIQNPEKYKKLNARIPSGAVLYGPPGTGKTLLAKALAGECGVKFFSCSGADFMQMFVGVGSSRIRDLYQEARKQRPAVIFIDEIDAIACDRDLNQITFRERESTLNQLLSEMDGFSDNSGVILIAGTNKFESLDKAILRPGRLDRHIYVGSPDIEGRKSLFQLYLEPIKIEGDKKEFVDKLAELTPGFTGASVKNLCNEAAILAARLNDKSVTMNHFDQTIDRILAGAKSGIELNKSDKMTVSTHEAGHATVGWFLKSVPPLVKVTVLPRGKALGFAQYMPRDQTLYSQQQLKEQIILLLGGRAAEEVVYNEITTSALDDIDKATKLAYQCVGVWGMNEKMECLSFDSLLNTQISAFGKYREFSSDTGNDIDNESLLLLSECYNKAKEIISKNIGQVNEIAKILNDKETIYHIDVENILGNKEN